MDANYLACKWDVTLEPSTIGDLIGTNRIHGWVGVVADGNLTWVYPLVPTSSSSELKVADEYSLDRFLTRQAVSEVWILDLWASTIPCFIQ